MTRLHWPFQLGYFASSAAAPPIVNIRTVAVATATAAAELRSNMVVLPALRTIRRRSYVIVLSFESRPCSQAIRRATGLNHAHPNTLDNAAGASDRERPRLQARRLLRNRGADPIARGRARRLLLY